MARTLEQILAEEKPEVVAAATETAAEILRQTDPEIAADEDQALVEIAKARLAEPQQGIKVEL